MSNSEHYHLRAAAEDSSPRVKQKPSSSAIPTPFVYFPSDDGTDENLLILLHGLGDTHVPFSKLGHSLKLPQTAVLALRAPQQVPYLYEDRYQWYESFTELGESISNPNPTSAIELMLKVLEHLKDDCAWPASRIHLFGFGQGGSVALETAVKYWRDQLLLDKENVPATSLGSIVTVSGPLLSFSTSSVVNPTPVLVIHRPKSEDFSLPTGALPAFKKAFALVRQMKLGSKGNEGMPMSKEEWQPIMEFWSEKLGRRQMEGLYEVMTGQT